MFLLLLSIIFDNQELNMFVEIDLKIEGEW